MSSGTYVEVSWLRDDRGKSLYDVLRARDRRRIFLEVLAPDHCQAENVAELANELEIGAGLRGGAVLAPLALSTFDGRPALELEHAQGAFLDTLLGAPTALGPFLDLAVSLVSGIGEVHAQGIIHGDLRPANMLVDEQTGVVRLCGLGLARRVAAEPSLAGPLRFIEGALPYLSPEQTGRLNRVADSRSELYSCGVVLYQLLAGRLPFAAQDALGWVHCHVARRPPAPADVVASIPAALSELVLRLLEKTPEARYQSAAGLLHDLRRCQATFRDTGRIAAFRLGEQDASDRFAIPQRLYGRERERALLLESFDEVGSSDGAALVLVGGAAGIGKSTLVRELQQPIAARSGRFVSGTFDQHRRDIPYAAFLDAIRELVLDVLAETAQTAPKWRSLMNDAIGAGGAMIGDLIPELRPVLGPSRALTPLPPAEAELRVRRVFGRLISAFASPERPLVVFLDDLQWADAASLTLLVDLLARGDSGHLLVVAAYRDNEVDSQHPFRHAVLEVIAAGTFVRELTLGPLSQAALEQLVADVVRTPRDEAAPLARVIGAKTAGSPFFVGHVLSELHRQGLLRFDAVAKRWCWDLDRVRQAPCSDNVVDLILEKLRDLPGETQETIRVAACLGAGFTANALAQIVDHEPGPALQAAVDADLLLQVGGGYRFPHDRVREAAYALVPADERARLHLRIGRQLLTANGGSPEPVEARIFDIVHHLHRATILLASVEEREEVAALDLLAAQRAQAAGAHASALSYFQAGANLLAADAESRRHALWFALELGRAESERLTGVLAPAEERLGRLAARAEGIVEQTAVVCVQAALAMVTNQVVRGVTLVLQHLQQFGIYWSPETTESAVRDEYERLRERIGDQTIEALVDMPPLSSREDQAKLDSLLALGALATMSNERLMYLSAARLAHLTVDLGHSDAAPLAFVNVGQMLGPYFGDFRSGFRYARLALELLERREQVRFRGEILLRAGAFVYPWTQPLPAALNLLQRADEAAREAGETLWLLAGAAQTITLRFLASGDSLEELGRQAEQLTALARKRKVGVVGDLVTPRARLIRALRGLTSRFARFDDAEFEERDYEAYLGGNPSLVVAEGWYWIRKLTARYLEGDYPAALAAGARAEALVWTSAFAVERVEYHLYHGLALAAHHDDAAPDQRPRHRAALAEHARALAARANDCRETFSACAALLAAELARIDDAVERAMHEYERALRAAREQGQAGLLAVALEIASRFYRTRGLVLVADIYLREARNAYARWGAEGKARAIDAAHPALASRERRPRDDAAAFRAEELDLLAIMKASRAISGALVREELLELLLTVVLEQGGARRARLILIRDDPQNGALEVVAEKSVDDAVARLQPAPRVPDSLLEYVKRTEAPVVLEDAQADAGRFANDPYFARAHPRSVLCLPVRRLGAIIGLIYLENDLTPGVFTRDRLMALELLAAQAAVSLENAHLLGRERQARAQAEADRQRAVLIGEATVIMSSSPDHRGVADAVRHVTARGFAEWAIVEAIDGGTMTPVACAHRDVAREPVLRRLSELYPLRVAAALAPYPLPEHTPVLHLPSLSDDQLRDRCVDDRHMELVRELGVRSVLALPLVARGAQVGVLSFGSGAPYGFPAADVELAVELGRMVAMSLDNARLTRLEDRLRHSQKMEAIGRLAGGVAHDFNNFLCVILSYEQLLRESLQEDDERRRELEEIQRAAERATTLTRQLLAFSRQQVTRPMVLDLNQEVRAMESLLAPLLGDEIELAFILSPSPEAVRADRGQLGQVLMNLVVNARDAMPSGGRITIQTRNVDLGERHARSHPGIPPGAYILLSVTDTGVGIDAQTQTRIFEPFFTTKESGKGTGLGLATVFSIVQQSAGYIALASHPGRGTTFTIYLPRCDARPQLGADAPARPTTASGTETILLVEDDPQVRLAVHTVLLRSGYVVVDASGPGDALLICEQPQTRIDLLVTDVQMPRLTGVELARRLRAARPGIRVLLMSGYADPAMVRASLREPGTAFLEKPITPDTLARAVRQVLDGGQRGNGDSRDGAGSAR